MDDFIKVCVVVFIILYIVSPVDACPGPIDDVVVALLGVAKCRKHS